MLDLLLFLLDLVQSCSLPNPTALDSRICNSRPELGGRSEENVAMQLLLEEVMQPD